MSVKMVTNEGDFLRQYEECLAGRKPVLAYRTKTITSGLVREVECYPVVLCDRSERMKHTLKTKAQMKINNLNNQRKRLERTLNTNFSEDDYFITVTNQVAVDEAEMRRRLHNYLQALRRLAAKEGKKLKYVYVIEWTQTERGLNWHAHMVVGRIADRDTVEKKWKYGRTDCDRLQLLEGTFNGMAAYLLKNRNRVTATGGKLYVCSQGLREPVVTISDKKMTRGRAAKVIKAARMDEQKRMMEQKNPGWRCRSVEVHFSDVFEGAYIYAQMTRD